METMTEIRRYADLLDGTLAGILEDPGLSNGARSELDQCTDIVRNILEEVDAYEKAIPARTWSLTKAENVLGKSPVR